MYRGTSVLSKPFEIDLFDECTLLIRIRGKETTVSSLVLTENLNFTSLLHKSWRVIFDQTRWFRPNSAHKRRIPCDRFQRFF
jgi:hypothetical protein